jgi:hypothetical protein
VKNLLNNDIMVDPYHDKLLIDQEKLVHFHPTLNIVLNHHMINVHDLDD